jgi:predicted kinase
MTGETMAAKAINALIVFTGPPCSGKSTLAAEVARRSNLPHLSMDATRQRLLPLATHTSADRDVAYRGMHFAAELLLNAGSGAVLDATYNRGEYFAELLQICGTRCKIIECRVSPETAVARLHARGWPDPTRPDLTDERVALLVNRHPYREVGLILDTETLSPAECLSRIEEYLLT